MRSAGAGAEARRVAADQRRTPAPSVAMFSRMSFCATRPSSTNTAWAAPRDNASSPSAPVPANRSSTRASLIGSPKRPPTSMENRLSRTRSVVGLRCAPASPLPTEASGRPRQFPAMILTL
jgi:hypothetical protein